MMIEEVEVRSKNNNKISTTDITRRCLDSHGKRMFVYKYTTGTITVKNTTEKPEMHSSVGMAILNGLLQDMILSRMQTK